MKGVSAAISEAQAQDPALMTSHFQMHVERDRTVLVNLKTGAIRIIPAQDRGSFTDFERSVEMIAEAFAEFRLP